MSDPKSMDILKCSRDQNHAACLQIKSKSLGSNLKKYKVYKHIKIAIATSSTFATEDGGNLHL